MIHGPAALLALAMACAAAGDALAQATPDAPISKECQTPGVEISGRVPLPNVQRALRDRKIIKILTIGGSSSPLVQHNGEDHHFIIEQLLEKTLQGVDVQIIDRGVSGELASDAAVRIKSEVALAEPDLVLWQIGTSDAFAHVPPEEFEATVDSTIEWLKGHDVDIVLVGLHYLRLLRRDAQYQAIREAIDRVTAKHNVLRVGRYEAMQVIEQANGNIGKPSPNEFAVTEAGYACLSEYVARALTTGIFLRSGALKPKN